MRLVALLVASVSLSACGGAGGGSSVPAGAQSTIEVRWGSLDQRYLGWTASGEPTVITIDVRLMEHPYAIPHTIQHEMGHAFGLGHEESPLCLMHSGIGDEGVLCPEEAAKMVPPRGPYALVVEGDALLVEQVRQAAEWWQEQVDYPLWMAP